MQILRSLPICHFATLLFMLITLLRSPSSYGEQLWHSESDTPQTISRDITNLYLSLQAAGNLPVRTYREERGEKIEEILRVQTLLVGPYFPKDLEVFMCSLNRQVCDISVNLEPNQNPTVRWKNKAGDVLTLPAIQFVKDTVPRPYIKRKGDSMESIVIKDRQGCESYDAVCQTWIQNLNPRFPDVLSRDFQGKIIVPTLTLDARIPDEVMSGPGQDRGNGEGWGGVEGGSGAGSGNVWSGIKSDKPSNFVNTTAYGSTTSSGKGLKWPPINSNIPSSISSNVSKIVPQIQFQLKDVMTGGDTTGLDLSHEPCKRVLLDTINFRDQPLLTYAVAVAMFDGKVDGNHCAFGSSGHIGEHIKVHNRPDLTLANRSPCGTFISSPNVLLDHGTHIAGIIVAQPDGIPPRGINPNALVSAYDDFGTNGKVDNSLVAADISTALKEYPTRVLNFSSGYTLLATGEDLVETRISISQENVLVSAAVDENRTRVVAKGCILRPACLNYQNVMSVVALDDSPTTPGPWQDKDNIHGSDYGPGFDIAAPGTGLCSTITNNRCAQLSGTSQATAVVSGAASLFFAKDPSLTPWKVKPRNRWGHAHDLGVSRRVSIVGVIIFITIGVTIAITIDIL